jgi:hypothetical protein
VYDPEQDAMIDQETGRYTEPAGHIHLVNGTGRFDRGLSKRSGSPISGTFSSVLPCAVRWSGSSPGTLPLQFEPAFEFFAGLAIAIMFNDPRFSFQETHPFLADHSLHRPCPDDHSDLARNAEPGTGCDLRTLENLFGWAPPWFTDPVLGEDRHSAHQSLAELSLLHSDLQRALQSISEDIYEAAQVDGANAWQRFRRITLPLLLVAVGPLLMASFVFQL